MDTLLSLRVAALAFTFCVKIVRFLNVLASKFLSVLYGIFCGAPLMYYGDLCHSIGEGFLHLCYIIYVDVAILILVSCRSSKVFRG